MNSSLILSVTTFVYGLAATLYLIAWIFHKPHTNRWATWVAYAGVIGNAAGFVLRWIESYTMGIGRIPLSNLYESLVFFSLMIAVIYLVIERKYHHQIIGAFAMPLAFLSIAYASLSPNISDRIQPLLPALKSNWLTVHVVTCFIGYAAFAVACGVSIMYLIKVGKEERAAEESPIGGILGMFPSIKVLDDINYKAIMVGFPMLTIGIITGAAWAN